MLPSPSHPYPPFNSQTVAGATALGRTPPYSTQPATGRRIFFRHHILKTSHGDELSTVQACAGTQLDDMVCRPDHVLIMLDHHDRVPKISQRLQSSNQASVILRMKSNAGLIKNIKDARESCSQLSSQSDPLELSPRQGRSTSIQREVSQSDLSQKAQPSTDFLRDRAHRSLTVIRNVQLLYPFCSFLDRQRTKLIDSKHSVLTSIEHLHRKKLLPQTPTVT